ncbi:MAG: hypothetical protein AB7S26_02410 [Sandaracinaceae bacterium]
MRCMRVAVSSLAILAVGCAQNAILELTADVPDAATVGVAPGAFAVLTFHQEATLPASFPVGPEEALPLPPIGEAVARVSVIASRDLALPLFVAVRYCSNESCGGLGDPNLASGPAIVRYERAFWQGEYTRHRLVLPTMAGTTTEVGKCEVIGCTEGDDPVSACDGALHFCE